MRFCLLTRFHSRHSRSSFVQRLMAEAAAVGHEFVLVNPAEVSLAFDGPDQFPVKWNGRPLPDFDLIHYSLRWDDNYAWEIVETLTTWKKKVLPASRVPLGDGVTMARLMARSGIAMPRTWVLANASQLPLILGDIGYPCMFRIRPSHLEQPEPGENPTGDRRSGRKVFFANHSAEAQGIAHSLSRVPHDCLVQEVLTPVGTDVRAYVVGGTILAAIARVAKPGLSRPVEEGNQHVQRTELSPDEQRLVLEAVKLYNAPYAGVSILRRENQQPLLLELARAPALNEVEQATQVNIAAAIVAFCAQAAIRNA